MRCTGMGLVFVGQKEGGHAAIPFGDDPEGVVAKTLHGLVSSIWISGQNTAPFNPRLFNCN